MQVRKTGAGRGPGASIALPRTQRIQGRHHNETSRQGPEVATAFTFTGYRAESRYAAMWLRAGRCVRTWGLVTHTRISLVWLARLGRAPVPALTGVGPLGKCLPTHGAPTLCGCVVCTGGHRHHDHSGAAGGRGQLRGGSGPDTGPTHTLAGRGLVWPRATSPRCEAAACSHAFVFPVAYLHVPVGV